MNIIDCWLQIVRRVRLVTGLPVRHTFPSSTRWSCEIAVNTASCCLPIRFWRQEWRRGRESKPWCTPSEVAIPSGGVNIRLWSGSPSS